MARIVRDSGGYENGRKTTVQVPSGVGDDALKDLDDRGIIRIGAEVRAGDILVHP